uniref:Bifunctional lysine-specific demethylase and histidyl-hydroxylase n=1 Tax=Strongyloides papillosus TaxID=174720 RepID=A0A0N5B8B2_STREA
MKRRQSDKDSLSSKYAKNNKRKIVVSDSSDCMESDNLTPIKKMVRVSKARKLKKVTLELNSSDSEIEINNHVQQKKTVTTNNVPRSTKIEESDDDIIELRREDAIYEEHESSNEDFEDEEYFDEDDEFSENSFLDEAIEVNDSDIEEEHESEPSDFEDLAATEAEDLLDLKRNCDYIYDPPYEEEEESYEDGGEDSGRFMDDRLTAGDIVLKDIKKLERKLFSEIDVYQHTSDLSEVEPHNWKKLPFSTKESSVEDGKNLFQWLIDRIPLADFMKEMYGRKCVNVKRNNIYYYGNLFSTDCFYKMIDKNDLEYGKNVNIALYKDGERTTHNGKGRVSSKDIKKALADGKSVQCINPQSFSDNIWYICDLLQEYTNSFVGANNYITPPKSSGFSPHWDDIDAFLLQVEGRKFWTVWSPENVESMFPLYSSGNFTERDTRNNKIVFQGWLEQGDLLYIPRGFIHHAKTDAQRTSHHAAPTVIESISQTFPYFRQTLPPNYFTHMGVADTITGKDDGSAKTIEDTLSLLSTTFNSLLKENLDCAADIMAKEYFINALPPKLTKSEKRHSVVSETELNIDPFKIQLSSSIRIIRQHTQRLLFDSDGGSYVIHRMKNSRTLDDTHEHTIGVPVDLCSLFELVIQSYPQYSKVKKLIKTSNVNEIEGLNFLQCIYEAGLLLVEDKQL